MNDWQRPPGAPPAPLHPPQGAQGHPHQGGPGPGGAGAQGQPYAGPPPGQGWSGAHAHPHAAPPPGQGYGGYPHGGGAGWGQPQGGTPRRRTSDKKIVAIASAIGVSFFVLVALVGWSMKPKRAEQIDIDGKVEVVDVEYSAASEKLTVTLKVPREFERWRFSRELASRENYPAEFVLDKDHTVTGITAEAHDGEVTEEYYLDDDLAPGTLRFPLTVSPERTEEVWALGIDLEIELTVPPRFARASPDTITCGHGCSVDLGHALTFGGLPKGTVVEAEGKRATADAEGRGSLEVGLVERLEAAGLPLKPDLKVAVKVSAPDVEPFEATLTMTPEVAQRLCMDRLRSSRTTWGPKDRPSGRVRAIYLEKDYGTGEILGSITHCTEVDLVATASTTTRTGRCPSLRSSTGSTLAVYTEMNDRVFTLVDRRTGASKGTFTARASPPTCPSSMKATAGTGATSVSSSAHGISGLRQRYGL